MTILEVYFINWYMKLAYFGNFAYCCFLLTWIFALAYEVRITSKKLKRLNSLALDNPSLWEQHYSNNIFKHILMIIIVLLEMAITGLLQMDALYIPTHFSLYKNETDIIQPTTTDSSILDCIGQDNFVGIGVGVFSVEMSVYLYIILTYSLCLNFYSMVFANKIKLKKQIKPTITGYILSTSIIALMLSKYTIVLGIFGYVILLVSAVLYLVISHKRLIRTIQAKRFDVYQERSKCQARRIDKELNYVRKIGGFIIIIGIIRVVSVFFSGSIDAIIIPIVQNPCLIGYVSNVQNIYPQIDGITQTIAQVVFTLGKIVNMSYVLLILSVNIIVVCIYYYQKKVQLQNIVNKKYTTYGMTLRKRLLE